MLLQCLLWRLTLLFSLLVLVVDEDMDMDVALVEVVVVEAGCI